MSLLNWTPWNVRDCKSTPSFFLRHLILVFKPSGSSKFFPSKLCHLLLKKIKLFNKNEKLFCCMSSMTYIRLLGNPKISRTWNNSCTLLLPAFWQKCFRLPKIFSWWLFKRLTPFAFAQNTFSQKITAISQMQNLLFVKFENPKREPYCSQMTDQHLT